jgi:hypothetical protein
MASKDVNKREYADGAEEEVEEASLNKQKTIDDSSSSSTDDYSSELEEEEMNLPAGSEEKLLIQRGRCDDGDISDSKKNNSIRNDRETSNDEQEQFSDDGCAFY